MLPLSQLTSLIGAIVTQNKDGDTVVTQGKLSIKLASDMLIIGEQVTTMPMPVLEHDGILYLPLTPLVKIFPLRFTLIAQKSLVKISFHNRDTTIPLLPAPPDGIADDWCRKNIRQLALGVAFLTQDHDQIFPPANDVWVQLKPLQINTQCLAKDIVANGYGYNSLLSGVILGKIADPAHTILFADGGNANNLLLSEKDIDQHRHHGGFFVAYVDGHVAWLPSGTPVELDYRKIGGKAQ